MKVKGPAFEILEYIFDKTHEGYVGRYKSKTKLLDKYKYVDEKSWDDSLKLYAEVRKLSNHDTSLVTVRDHAKNTLNLAMTTGNKVSEMGMNLKNIPTTDMINLQKQAGDIIYTDLLKATLQVSKLQSSKRKVENLLRWEKVKNKSHQTQIKKLQVELLVADKGAAEHKLLS